MCRESTNISRAYSLISCLTFHGPWDDMVGDNFNLRELRGKRGLLRAARPAVQHDRGSPYLMLISQTTLWVFVSRW